MAEPVSPCTGTCTLDPVSSLCRGCLRTIDEIMVWPGATSEHKQTILGAVAQRRQSVSVRSK
jgi:predicted Fe-S protein YdhL (DUF1289 family)